MSFRRQNKVGEEMERELSMRLVSSSATASDNTSSSSSSLLSSSSASSSSSSSVIELREFPSDRSLGSGGSGSNLLSPMSNSSPPPSSTTPLSNSNRRRNRTDRPRGRHQQSDAMDEEYVRTHSDDDGQDESPRGTSNRDGNNGDDLEEGGGGGGGRGRNGDDGDGDGAAEDQRRPLPSVLADGWNLYFKRSLHAIFLTSWLNILLITIPFAIFAYALDWGDAPLLVLSLLALCPLAERISFVTDELARYTNDTVGGLLSATMGNMTEVIVSIFALRKGLLRVVQVSLLGSILSNLLLVLGCAFFAGGLKHSVQKYNKAAASTNSGLLMLGVMALLFPMTLTATHMGSDSDPSELRLSRFSCFCLLSVYALLIVYQLKTHRVLFEAREEPDDDDEPPVLGPAGAFLWGVIIMVLISVLSEFVVSTIEGAAKQLRIPVLFIATILLPIVGNAAEHASAVIFAYRNRMDISLGIAVGSATQIALFVVPLSVILGWMWGQPLSLDFQIFETITLFLTVSIVTSIINSGRADWLRGLLLVVAYMLISASYWVHATPPDL